MVEQTTTDDYISSEDTYVYSITKDKDKIPHVSLKMQNTPVGFVIDTDAGVNILDKSKYQQLPYPPKLKPSHCNVVAYGSKTAIPISGAFEGFVESETRFTLATFHVPSETPNASLLNYSTASDLLLVKIVNAIMKPT